jgi:SAM-dependent methyltransferase
MGTDSKRGSTEMTESAPKPITRAENHEHILRMIENEARGRVLDAPCGEGALSIRLKEMGFTVECCDIDLDLFKVKELTVRYAEFNLGTIPHPDQSFDLVTSVNGLHRLWNPQNAIDEYVRVLKPGGVLFASIPNYARISRRLRFLIAGGIARNISKKNIYQKTDAPAANFRQPLLFSQIKYGLEDRGFVIEHIESSPAGRAKFFYYPLALLIRLAGAGLSQKVREAFCVRESNSQAILMGSRHLFIKARKVSNS